MNHLEAENEINAMKNVDIRTVDKEQLVDIRTISIDENLPLEERIMDFLQKIRNPYCYRVGKIAVKIEYEDTDITFEQRFEKILANG